MNVSVPAVASVICVGDAVTLSTVGFSVSMSNSCAGVWSCWALPAASIPPAAWSSAQFVPSAASAVAVVADVAVIVPVPLVPRLAPLPTTMADRVRIQNVGLSTVVLGQGVPFLHAGSDLLRSKSFDRDSFNSGDWFNRIDWTLLSTNWGRGLPVAEKNQDKWPIMAPLLADPSLAPQPADVERAVDSSTAAFGSSA